MGKIVAAMGTVHAPQLFDRPPSEDPKQLDADIAAMRLIGKDLEEAKPDAVIVIGSDHLETFFLSSVPTFAILSGEFSHAEFAGRKYELPIHEALTEDLLDKLMKAGFDLGYSQDAVLGHAFAAVYEWVIEKRPDSRRSDFRQRISSATADGAALRAAWQGDREDHRQPSGECRHRCQRRHVAFPRHVEISEAGFRFRPLGHRPDGAGK